MTLRLLRRLMNADALGIQIIVFALWTFTYGIASSLRNTDTSSFLWICLIAAGFGFGVAKARLNGILASAGMAALGVLLVWILGARLAQPLLELFEAAFSTLPQAIAAIRFNTRLDVSPVVEAWTVIAQSSSSLATRLQTWMIGLNRSVTINDALLRNMAWTLILWLCAGWMGWFTERRNAVAAFLPAMSLLAAVLSYSEYRTFSLWGMVVLLLLLMGTWNYRNHTLQWLKRRIDYSDSIGIDNGQAVILLTVAIGTFAFITPSISWQDILDYVRARQEENEAAEMLGVQQPRGSGSPVGAQTPSLPRDHLLTGGNANSEKVVMFIRTGELPPLPSEALPGEAPRYYWRSTVYDRYVGSGWVTSTAFTQNIPADTPLIPGLLNGYRPVHMDVEMVEPEGRLFWSGVLFSADIPFTVNWRVRPPTDLFADQQALLLADVFAAATDAVAYQAETYIPVPTIEDLRSASTEYPEDIRVRYLPLPPSVPERVRLLAADITRGLATPYDKAKAIETHLRTDYPYDLEVPSPAANRDVADYFLFDLKKGYCDYYATAMVVLARLSGLPARFVSGYAPGSYDAPNARYIVRELHAHSWAEIYFPEIGWVEFEPTASLPEIERSAGALPLPSEQENEGTASRLLTRFRMERILLWSSPLLSLMLVVILYYAFLERWLVLRLAPADAIDRVYQRFYRSARPLAGAWTRAETSTEFLDKLTSRVTQVQRRTRWKKLPADIRTNASTLTDMYHTSLFVDHGTTKRDALAAWILWKRLRRQLFNLRSLLRFVNGDHAFDRTES